jgi:hypothetical protein
VRRRSRCKHYKKNKVLKNIEILKNSNVLYWYSGLNAFNDVCCIRVRFPANAHLCVGWLFFISFFFKGSTGVIFLGSNSPDILRRFFVNLRKTRTHKNRTGVCGVQDSENRTTSVACKTRTSCVARQSRGRRQLRGQRLGRRLWPRATR